MKNLSTYVHKKHLDKCNEESIMKRAYSQLGLKATEEPHGVSIDEQGQKYKVDLVFV